MSMDRDVVEALAEELDREPWEPVTWKVGDKVRVLARPECLYCIDSEREDGAIGTVAEVERFRDPSEWAREAMAHRYWVDFDVDMPDGCRSPFAACELVSAEASGDGVEEG